MAYCQALFAESRRAVYGVAHRQYWRCRHWRGNTRTMISGRLGIRLRDIASRAAGWLRRDGDR